jgi:hypothetical protein
VSSWRRRVVATQAIYYVVTGLWPIFHLRSFEAVTGPKVDDWLVHTVGLLAAACVSPRITAVPKLPPMAAAVSSLAMASAFAFAAIDLWYGLSGRIAHIYLADAAVEVGLMAALLRTRGR